MGLANNLAVARDAAAKAKANKITYAQQDCQKFVKQCVIDCGGSFSSSGSNDMYRNACDWVKPLPKGVKPEDLKSGYLLFKHDFDGKEPSKYKADGKGNARHVGLYCGVDGVEVAHSTTGGVQTAKLSAGWNYYGPAKCMSYGTDTSAPNISPPDTQPTHTPQEPQAGQAMVVGGGKLRLRNQPDADAGVIKSMPLGTIVKVLGRALGWANVEYVDDRGMRHVGFCSEQYLKFGE